MFLKTGTILQKNKYRIDEVIGQGGFGISYRAYDLGLDREIAIKEFFYSQLCTRAAGESNMSVSSSEKNIVPKLKIKFIDEARNIAKLKHQHIVKVYDVFEENETAYFVMEYIKQGSLADFVKTNGRMSVSEVKKYALQLCDALKYMHDKEICHLDIKPSNILLDDEDCVKLIDFGLSKQYANYNQHTSTLLAFSSGYAPLEQYSSSGIKTFQPTIDIYSLGATMYFLLTGIKPQEATILATERLKPIEGLSKTINDVIAKAMSTNIKDRPQTIDDLKNLIYKIKPTNKKSINPEIPEIDNDNTDGPIPDPSKSDSPLTLQEKLIRALVFSGIILLMLGWSDYFYSTYIFSKLTDIPIRFIKIPQLLLIAHLVGMSSFVVFYLIGFEFVKKTNLWQNIFSVLAAMLYYIILYFAVWILPNQINYNVEFWFFFTASIIPIFIYTMRYLIWSKLVYKYAKGKKINSIFFK